MSLAPVEYTPELERVMRIPRRRWTAEEAQLWSDRLTPLLRTAEGERQGVKLFPLQALALKEVQEVRGGFLALPVGEGKTLTAWLLPYVLDVSRSLYFNPANSSEDRARDFALLARHWVSARPPPRIESYTMLTREEHWDMLHRFKPQLIMADEGDLLRNPDSSMCMRLDEYAKADPSCVFVILTGTPMRKSIKNICHLMHWTHKTQAPVPLTYRDRESWSNALDERVDLIKRQRPGALVRLAEKEDIGASDLETARNGFQRRLWETPGVIYVDKQSCNTPLSLRLLQAPEDRLLDEAFHHFRMMKATPPFIGEPKGYELAGPLEMYRVGNELGAGFFSRWDPLPPTPWREARSAWSKFSRSQIGRKDSSGRMMATELMVAKQCANHPLHLAWREIEPTFKPNSVPQWISGSVVGFARDWLAAQQQPAIVWCPFLPAGEALSKITGLRFYQAGGETLEGESIIRADPKKSMICSLHSNKRGRNLQAWARHLVFGWPQPGTDVEQMLGRPHRNGQDKPVYFDVVISCAENLYAIDQSYREAGFVKAMQKQTQKILLAKVDSSRVTNYVGSRWSKD